MQALSEGDLSERARRRAAELANDADLRIRTPRDPFKHGSAEVHSRTTTGTLNSPRDPRLPLPGTLLVREFRGKTIVVKVLDEGFEYDNQRYKSLSAIARKVTGNKWNGFLYADRFLSPEERPLFEAIIGQDFVFNKSSDFMQVELVAVYFLTPGRAQEAGDWDAAERLDRMIRCRLMDLKAAPKGGEPGTARIKPARKSAKRRKTGK